MKRLSILLTMCVVLMAFLASSQVSDAADLTYGFQNNCDRTISLTFHTDCGVYGLTLPPGGFATVLVPCGCVIKGAIIEGTRIPIGSCKQFANDCCACVGHNLLQIDPC